MQRFLKRRITVLTVLLVGLVGVMVASGGDLDPPVGPVAPTMKTLTEVEPRLAINEENTPGNTMFQFIIDEPGSYYLTHTVTTDEDKGGILVLDPSVTIDLNGYAIKYGGGAAGAASGVHAADYNDVTIRNGTLEGFLVNGLITGDRGLIEDVRTVECVVNGIETGESSVITGCVADSNFGSGIVAGDGTVIRGCASTSNGGNGILAGETCVVKECTSLKNVLSGFDCNDTCILSNCAASKNGLYGFDANLGVVFSGCTAAHNSDSGFRATGRSSFENCVANQNLENGFVATGSYSGCTADLNGQFGFWMESFSTVHNCTACINGSHGIFGFSGATITDCVLVSNLGSGILANADCLVRSNTCRRNGIGSTDGAGIRVTSHDNRIEGNNVTDNRRGIEISSGPNIVVKNTASGNVNLDNYVISPGNDVGTIQTSPVGALAWDNFEF